MVTILLLFLTRHLEHQRLSCNLTSFKWSTLRTFVVEKRCWSRIGNLRYVCFVLQMTASDYILGEYCEGIGISKANLQDTTLLPKLSSDMLTKGIVFELNKYRICN